MNQVEAWHGGWPRPWPHCIRWGPSFPSLKGAQPPSPIFGLCLLVPLGREVGLDPGNIVLGGHPALSPKKGAQQSPRPMSIVAKRSPISATAKHLLFFIFRPSLSTVQSCIFSQPSTSIRTSLLTYSGACSEFFTKSMLLILSLPY